MAQIVQDHAKIAQEGSVNLMKELALMKEIVKIINFIKTNVNYLVQISVNFVILVLGSENVRDVQMNHIMEILASIYVIHAQLLPVILKEFVKTIIQIVLIIVIMEKVVKANAIR
jgi:hypothetical protein